MPLFSFEMPLFSSPSWNVNIRPESHLVSTINIDGPAHLGRILSEKKATVVIESGKFKFVKLTTHKTADASYQA